MLKFTTQNQKKWHQKSFSSLFKNKQQKQIKENNLNCSNIDGTSKGNNRESYWSTTPTVAVLSTVNTQPLTIIPIHGSPTPPIPRRLTLPISQQNQTVKQQRLPNSSSPPLTSTTTLSQSVPSLSTTTSSSSSTSPSSSKTTSTTTSSSPPSCSPPSSSGSLGSILTNSNTSSKSSRIFPSTRFFIALLLCLCYISLSISTSNISVSMVCMIKRTSAQQVQQQQEKMQSLQIDKVNNNNQNNMQYGIDQINAQEKEKSDVFILLRRRKRENKKENIQKINSTEKSKQLIEKQSECANNRRRRKNKENDREIRSIVYFESCHEAEKLSWSSTDQGIVFAAQNAGSLFMLFTGAHADRLNSKWTITGALILLVLSNALLPLVSSISVWLVVAARLLTGLSDALLQPSTSSLITRWFPPKERPFAIGLITGGRQIGWLVN
uniref:MFS domain-containing protein n=1 Tax=Meloidogyne hapla TaxID=6305 RepID=A0A1I8B4R4_MELHA